MYAKTKKEKKKDDEREFVRVVKAENMNESIEKSEDRKNKKKLRRHQPTYSFIWFPEFWFCFALLYLRRAKSISKATQNLNVISDTGR